MSLPSMVHTINFYKIREKNLVVKQLLIYINTSFHINLFKTKA